MSQAEQLANRLEEVFLNGTWIANTNWKDQLNQTSYNNAILQLGTVNSIASLTFHITYYLKGVLQVMQGGGLTIKDKYSFDCPALENEADWETQKNELITTAEMFVSAVRNLNEAQLQADFADPKYGTYARNLEAIIEHSYYHLGQVVLLRKTMSEC